MPEGCLGENQKVVEPSAAVSAAGDGACLLKVMVEEPQLLVHNNPGDLHDR
jgi:hypothetical protein